MATRKRKLGWGTGSGKALEKSIIESAVVVLAAACILMPRPFACAAAADSGEAKPNFVIIYCDDLGYGDLGCTGSRAIATQNVDRLAPEGVRLTEYYACSGVCAPSRAGLFTGRYPFRSGVIGNVYPQDEPFRRRAAREYVGGALKSLGVLDLREGKVAAGIPPTEILLGEALKTAGYRTGMVGNWKYFRKLNRYVWPIPLDTAAAVSNRLGGDQLGYRWPLLCNLDIDPGESYNVIDTYPDIGRRIEDVMRRWETEAGKNPGGWL